MADSLSREFIAVVDSEPFTNFPGHIHEDVLEVKAREQSGYDHQNNDLLTARQLVTLAANTEGLYDENIGYLEVGDPDRPNRLYMIDLLLGNCAVRTSDGTIIDGDSDPHIEEELRRLMRCFRKEDDDGN